MRVAIIGGGMAGLSTAYYLLHRADHRERLEVRLYEALDRFGGVVRTVRQQGYLLDLGPDSIFTVKPEGLALARELGLEEQLLPAHTGLPVHILWEGKLHPLPAGWSLIAPTRWRPFLGSSLLSLAGKARAALEPLVPARRSDEEESVACFVRRRLGREVYERIGDPLLAGIHAADPERLSIQATFPRLPALEQQHGSLIKGLHRQRRRDRRSAAAASSGGPPPPPFVSFKAGMEALVTRVSAAIDEMSPTTLCSGQKVTELKLISPLPHKPPPGSTAARSSPEGLSSPKPGGNSSVAAAAGAYELRLASGSCWQADACVLALPAAAAARLVASFDRRLADALLSIPYASTAAVYLGYPASTIPAPLEGTGILVPFSQGRQVFGCTFVSRKFDGRAPAGATLLRLFIGGRRRPHLLERSDEELLQIARREVGELLGVVAEPELTRLQRWPRANPQYEVGHAGLVRTIDACLRRWPRLAIAGSCCRGVGIPDTIASGQQTARAIADALGENP
ncbi:MAG: protoporphyrinogen oxidase [Acidobacteriota bacterium]